MKGSKILFWILFPLFLAGCTHGTSSVKELKKPYHDHANKILKAESEILAKVQKELVDTLEKVPPKAIELKPVMPAYNPLEDHMVSFSMVQEDLQLVLYSLSQAVGMNLIIDPSISKEERLLTLHFEKASADTVLNEILNSFDYYYEVEENIIRIKPFQERIFRLNFLDTEIAASFEVGGDVLGAADTGAKTGLTGSFKLAGKGAKKGNSYNAIEDMVKQIISRGGKYSLNRMSGSLYVKDTPAVIRSISKLVNYVKDMLSRQISKPILKG